MLTDCKICAFLTVVDEGSFTAAARRLGISQPAISAQIASLESSLGFPLFQRGRTLTLTPEGESFLPYACRIQAAYDLANDTFGNVFGK